MRKNAAYLAIGLVFACATAWAANEIHYDRNVLFRDSVSVFLGTDGDVEARWDGTDLDVLAAADNSVIKFGATGNSFDVWFYGSDSDHPIVFDASADDLVLYDSVSLMLGTGSDVEFRWDGTDLDILAAADNSIVKWGAAGNSFDHWFYGSDANKYFSFDASADDLKFEDSVSVMFGTGSAAGPGAAGDVEIRWDATDLDLLCTTNNTIFKIGDGTTSFDVWLFGASSSAYWSWDASANDLKAEDSTSLMFGTGAGAGPGNAGDVELRWDATDFDILAAADDTVLKLGTGTSSFDVWIYGDTASEYLLWDASRDSLILTGNAKIIPTNGVTWFDDFQDEVWDTNEYTTNTDADPTLVVAIVEGAAGVGGYLSMAADDVANDKQEFAGALSYNSSKVTVFECRIAIAADVTTTRLNVGLSDAKNEAAQTIAFTISGTTVTENATDGAVFLYDTDADTDGWFGCIAGTTDEDEGGGATAPTAGVYQTLRIEINASRAVSFYIDGTQYGSTTTAVLDASKSLGFYLATQSTTTVARTVNLDYVYIWQDR